MVPPNRTVGVVREDHVMTMTSNEYRAYLRIARLHAQGKFIGPVLPMPTVVRVQYQPRGTRY